MKKHLITKAFGRLDFFPFNKIVDIRSWTTSVPFYKAFARTQRYRIANMGLPLTNNEKEILALKDKHKEKRAFIIGNGPSLNKCDLTKLKDEFTFGVNGIYLNYDNMGFAPYYYVVEDTFVAEDRADEINKYKGPQKQFFGNYLGYCIKDKPDNLWLNVIADYRNYEDFPHFSKNLLRRVWVGGTVTYLCLQIAYYMGFEEIYMIGFDHSYHIPKDAIITNEREAGFDILSQSDDVNHFHPDYFGKGYRWHDPKVERMEKAFIKARKAFESDGRTIKNATVGGYLEAFDRVEYETLF